MSKFELVKISDSIAEAEANNWEIPSDPVSVIEELLDCVTNYCPEYMHGNKKSVYVEAAKKCLMELEKNG